jgi:hypothetical protein
MGEKEKNLLTIVATTAASATGGTILGTSISGAAGGIAGGVIGGIVGLSAGLVGAAALAVGRKIEVSHTENEASFVRNFEFENDAPDTESVEDELKE